MLAVGGGLHLLGLNYRMELFANPDIIITMHVRNMLLLTLAPYQRGE